MPFFFQFFFLWPDHFQDATYRPANGATISYCVDTPNEMTFLVGPNNIWEMKNHESSL